MFEEKIFQEVDSFSSRPYDCDWDRHLIVFLLVAKN